ncbi:hypothetical protein OIU76_017002 [Salix suchowensis]|nr:hypothetical protein OIU76_017002 [Salix suchowensis]
MILAESFLVIILFKSSLSGSMCYELSNAVSETYSVQIITKIFASVHSLVQTNNGQLSLQAPASMPPTVNGGDQNTLSCLHATTLSMALLMMDQLLDLMIGVCHCRPYCSIA